MRPTWLLWPLALIALLHAWTRAGLPFVRMPIEIPEDLQGTLPVLGDGLSWGLLGYTTAASVVLLVSSVLQRLRARRLSREAAALRFEPARDGKEGPEEFMEFLNALYPAFYTAHPFLLGGHSIAVTMLSTEPGVEFLIFFPHLPRRDLASEIQAAVSAHYPGARLLPCADPIPEVLSRGGVLIRERWRLARDVVVPLRDFSTWKDDPLNGRLRAARVPPGAGVRALGLTLILRAVPARREEGRIAGRIRRLESRLHAGRRGGGGNRSPIEVNRLAAARRKQGKEQDLPLFEAVVETFAVGKAEPAGRLLRNLDRSILAHTTYRQRGAYQELVRVWRKETGTDGRSARAFLRREMPVRLPALLPGIEAARKTSLLTAVEASTVLHFPSPSKNPLPRLRRQRAVLLPAPQAAYVDGEPGRVTWGMGEEEYGPGGAVGPGTRDRTMGAYVAGPTGSGKSTLLQNIALQDIAAGRGVATLDLKGGLNEEIIRRLRKEDEERVIVFDPARSRRVVGLNPFDRRLVELVGVEGLSSHLMGFFQKLVGANWTTATRVRSLLGSAVPLILELEEKPSLLHMYAFFLPDSAYRKELIERCRDPILAAFWGGEFDEKGFADSILAVQTRLREFLRNRLVRSVLCQERSTVDIPDLMRRRMIFLGRLTTDEHGVGEETQGLLGALLLGQFLGAALSRTGREEAENLYGVILDEFQSVVETGAKDIQELFAKARSGGLMLIAAHQSPEQLDGKTLSIILDNVPNVVLFQQTGPGAKFFASTLQAFAPEDILNLPPFHAYARFKVGNRSTGVFSMSTVKLPEAPEEAPAGVEFSFEHPEEDALDRLFRLPPAERMEKLVALSEEDFRAYRARRRKRDLAERAYLLEHPEVDLTPLYPWTTNRKIARVYYISDLMWGTPPEEVEAEVRRFLKERGLMPAARKEPARVIPFERKKAERAAKEAGR